MAPWCPAWRTTPAMLGNRFIAPTDGLAGPLLGLAACVLVLCACESYDATLLREPSSARADAGHDGPPDAGHGADAGNCVPAPETCNAIDDDCDGRVDEETIADCESIVVHAETKCVQVGDQAAPQAACVRLNCLAGYDDCDGRPQNGCEKPFCSCNDCSDAGGDAGEDTDAGG